MTQNIERRQCVPAARLEYDTTGYTVTCHHFCLININEQTIFTTDPVEAHYYILQLILTTGYWLVGQRRQHNEGWSLFVH